MNTVERVFNDAEKAIKAKSDVRKFRLKFPFRVQQCGDCEIEIEAGGRGLSFVNADQLMRVYPWLKPDQCDAMIEMLYNKANEQAIRDGMTIIG